ncbi:general substrate transporter [Calocera viscosa TUFC12733]|uniref:General substrate transporter n=1 Tax=Calocera viscosa (strain TUFC12733) TaxID=1330018 RepID=A0A167QJM3_CALVF|nr:general substrate transporter [Calocera viscosa TUFC12733]
MVDVLPERKGWWNYRYLWRLNFALLSALLSQATGGYDGSLLNGLQSLPLWTNYFDHPAGARLGVLNVGISIGQSVSTIFAGFICDKFGRRIPLGVGCWIVIIGSILGAASTTFGMFLGARILVGFGDGLCQVASPTMLAELSHPSQRAQIQSMYAPSYPLGGIIAAWTTYATFTYTTTWSWRLPLALQGVFALIQFTCLLFSPESPRWLIANGQREKAIAVLVKHHANGDEDSELVKFEVSEIEEQISRDALMKSYSWLEFFKTKGNRRRFYTMLFFPLARQFTGSNLISYFLPLVLDSAGITNSKTQLIINGGVNICAFLFAITTFLYVDKFGRRPVLIIPMVLCIVSLVIWTIFSALIIESNYTRPNLGYGVVVMVFWFQGWIHVFDAAAEPYIQELSTFVLRSKIVVMWQFGQQVVGYISSFANPVAMGTLGWKYIILYVVLDCVYVAVMFAFFPETKGLSLEECALLFDGEEAIAHQHAAEAHAADAHFELHKAPLESDKSSKEEIDHAEFGGATV